MKRDSTHTGHARSLLGGVLMGALMAAPGCDDDDDAPRLNDGGVSALDAAAGAGGTAGQPMMPDAMWPMDTAAPTGALVWAIDGDGRLLSFRATAPGILESRVPITGLAGGETLVGLTVRHLTGELIALGSTSRLYTLARATGAATAIGTAPFSPALAGTRFGVDFNPVVDRIRVVSDEEQNLRLHPTMGTVVDSDAATAGVQPDPSLTPPGAVVAAAYTSDTSPPVVPTKTTLFVIDPSTDRLLRQGGPDGNPSPNAGVLTPIGPLGIDAGPDVGFDIEPVTNAAYAALTVGGASGLYRVDLGSGAATSLGGIGVGSAIRALALDLPVTSLYMRLGSATGIRSVVDDFVGRVVADPKINGYFLNASVDGDRLTKCLRLQLGALTGGPETYPSMGCRSMKESHKDLNLGISMKDFEDLAGHLVAALQKAGVSSSDVMTIVNALTPMAGDIVQDPANNATVYQRVGRKPAIGGVIDQFIAKVVADVRIQGFFTAVDAPRLRTCLVRQVCSIDGPCRYGSEVDGEPGVAKSNPCRSMKASHQNISTPRRITITDFNALVEDLVVVLDGAGVTAADKNAILGALGPMCRDIVDGGTGCPQ